MIDNNAMNNWQLYKVGNDWYFQVWDNENARWSVHGPFGTYSEASRNRDSMMSDAYQDE